MGEFQKFETWVHALDLNWDVKDQKDQIQAWLIERENAAIRWSWNRVARQVAVIEKKTPLDEAETTWLENLEVAAEIVVMTALHRHDGFSEEVGGCLRCVYEDFQLLARAARLNHHDPFLDLLRAEYNAGRFPRSNL